MSYVGQINAGGVTSPIASTLFGVCDTAADVAAKVVTCSDFDQLIEGVTIHVKFNKTNTTTNPTLNVNGTGAKPISGVCQYWQTGAVVSFTYNGSIWYMNDTVPGLIRYNSGSVVGSNNTFTIQISGLMLLTIYDNVNYTRNIYICYVSGPSYAGINSVTVIELGGNMNYITKVENKDSSSATLLFTVNSNPGLSWITYRFI